VRDFSEEAVYRHAATDRLDAGDQHAGGLGRYGQRRDSVQLPAFRQPTSGSKWEGTSTSMMGCVTSATTKRHLKSRRRPKLRLRGIHSYVWMVVPLAA
jgi:hypothetical protein